MKDGGMFVIKVPGSTANLGPGFDSIGLALNRYLTLTVSSSDEWCFEPTSKEVQEIPKGKDNLIYIVANEVAERYNMTLPPCYVKVDSAIPMARGLGSSAAAIVAGVELANQLLKLNLSQEDKIKMASMKEGHPDNACASLLGGLVVGVLHNQHTFVNKLENVDVDVVAVIPPYYVYTSDSRGVLPATLPYENAIEGSAISNVVVANLCMNNWGIVGELMEKDVFHEPYRAKLVPELQKVRQLAKEFGAYGTVLSGAGPTILSFVPKGLGEFVAVKLEAFFPHCEVSSLSVDLKGVEVERQFVGCE